jgi:hypothetical protein
MMVVGDLAICGIGCDLITIEDVHLMLPYEIDLM